MHLRNEINRIGMKINQIVKYNNSHVYDEVDRQQLRREIQKINNLL